MNEVTNTEYLTTYICHIENISYRIKNKSTKLIEMIDKYFIQV